MKLSEYAERKGIHYRTAWTHFHQGKIKGAYLDETPPPTPTREEWKTFSPFSTPTPQANTENTVQNIVLNGHSEH